MKCGFYKKEITPPLGSYIPGYGDNRRGRGVKDELYVKALVMEDASGNRFAIASLDSLMLEMEHTEAILARVKEYTDLTEKNTVLTCIHAHTGTPFWQYDAADTAYMQELFRMVADCIILAWQRLQPCEVTYGVGKAEGISFVRDYVLKDGRIVTWGKKGLNLRPYAESDPEVGVLFFRDAGGKPIGAVSNFACHCDCVGGEEYSADFPGVMARRLEKEWGADFISIFLPGFSGDINHVNAMEGIRMDYKVMGVMLADEVIKIAASGKPIGADTIDFARKELYLERRVVTPEMEKRAKEILADPACRRPEEHGFAHPQWMLSYAEEYANAPLEVRCPVQTIKLGDIFLYCLPGEMYCAFGKYLKTKNGGKGFPVQLCATRAGYIPTPELMESDVYPAELSNCAFLQAGAGDQLVQAALDLADALK